MNSNMNSNMKSNMKSSPLSSLLSFAAGTAFLAVLIQLWMILPTGKEGVRFYYHTSGNVSRQELTSLESVPISRSSNTTVIIHGLIQSSQAEWIQALTRALLNQEHKTEQVIILVDYWDMMVLPRPQMLENGRNIAKETAHLLDYFALHKHLNLSQCHLIGYSFGGLISGMVSNYITKGTLGRVTGLDPSYPYKMKEYDPSYFIDVSDAEIVTTIRTSVVSDKIPQTTIDFYPNGGLMQPGCDKWYMPELAQNLCSHRRATWLMVEAFEQTNLISFESCSCNNYESYINKICPCKIKNNFGISINPRFTGKFFLLTHDKPPFSRM